MGQRTYKGISVNSFRQLADSLQQGVWAIDEEGMFYADPIQRGDGGYSAGYKHVFCREEYGRFWGTNFEQDDE